MIDNLIEQMVLGCRLLSEGGHDDFNQGQISSRLDDDRFVIKDAMVGFGDAQSSSFCICYIDPSKPMPKDAPPETPLHQAIYAKRTDVCSIVHSHPENAIVFGATDLPLKPISHEGCYFDDNVGRFDETTNTILEISSGEAVANALGSNNALFLCNHGIVVAAKTTRLSVVLALMLERACRLQLKAETLGIEFRFTKGEEIAEKKAYIYSDLAVRSYWKHAVSRVKSFENSME